MPEADTQITLTANGESHAVADGTSLHDFVRSLGLEPKQVVVEHNGEALTQSEAATTQLVDGDRLEIVRIVAGG